MIPENKDINNKLKDKQEPTNNQPPQNHPIIQPPEFLKPNIRITVSTEIDAVNPIKRINSITEVISYEWNSKDNYNHNYRFNYRSYNSIGLYKLLASAIRVLSLA